MQTPRYEYSRSAINERIQELKNLSSPFGLVVRYAMKANQHREILKMMHEGKVHFDASSSYEAAELLEMGIPGSHISLSSQQSPHNLPELLGAGTQFVAASKRQLQLFLDTPGRPDAVGVRINPDMGYGHNNRTSTGGLNASFGIWYEYIPELLEMTRTAGVAIDRLHLHIGSGFDTAVWGRIIDRALEVARQFPEVTSLDIGGGYKVHRFGKGQETDMPAVIEVFNERLRAFAEETGRELQLEIEPGSYFVAHAGTLVATVDDVVDTGAGGYTFLKLNTGMNDFIRTAMYGAQHRIEIVNDSDVTKEYVVVGHCCESGDILTTTDGDPEQIETRTLKEATIGDEVRVYDAGAYCASMRATGYNSFPDAIEVMVD